MIIKRTDKEFHLLPTENQKRGVHVPDVNIREISGLEESPLGMVRVYRTYVGDPDKNEDHYSFQIRARQPLKDGLKPRDIIARVSLSSGEILALADYIKQENEKTGSLIKKHTNE